MRKLTTKEIVLLIILVFIVSGALYYNYFFNPYQQKMMDLGIKISTDNQRLLTLQNEQQSIIRDTEKLNNELVGVEEEFHDIPKGIDEPSMLVYIQESLAGAASDATVRFSPEVSMNEYFQTSQVLISFYTTYPNLRIILDSFYNAPFRNRVVYLNAIYEQQQEMLGPQLGEEDGAQTDEAQADTVYNYLYVEMSVDCFTIPGDVTGTDYPFMIGPYNNPNPFEPSIP